MFTQKSPVTVAILSLVTCGIYGFIWLWGAMNELYNAGHKSIGNLNPTIQFLLLFLYVGLPFFALNANDNLNAVRAQKGQPEVDNKVMYVILSIVFWPALAYMVQDEMNKLA